MFYAESSIFLFDTSLDGLSLAAGVTLGTWCNYLANGTGLIALTDGGATVTCGTEDGLWRYGDMLA